MGLSKLLYDQELPWNFDHSTKMIVMFTKLKSIVGSRVTAATAEIFPQC